MKLETPGNDHGYVAYLNRTCRNCGHRYGDHSARSDACPIILEDISHWIRSSKHYSQTSTFEESELTKSKVPSQIL